MKDYLSPAFYLTPPMDTGTPNVIYINPSANYQGLELFTTLAHEGFPGHLYQTVSFERQNRLESEIFWILPGLRKGGLLMWSPLPMNMQLIISWILLPLILHVFHG